MAVSFKVVGELDQVLLGLGFGYLGLGELVVREVDVETDTIDLGLL